MNRPICPDHHGLVLDLARGRLEDDAAAEAETVRRACPVCRAWWCEHLEGEAAAAVDDAVAAALTELELPRRRPRRGWLAAAAAVVMALGAGGLWLAQRPRPVVPNLHHRVAVIEAFDFESPATRPRVLVSEAESADLKRDSMAENRHAKVDAVPTVADQVIMASAGLAGNALEEVAKPISTGDFESGDLGGWVPGT